MTTMLPIDTVNHELTKNAPEADHLRILRHVHTRMITDFFDGGIIRLPSGKKKKVTDVRAFAKHRIPFEDIVDIIVGVVECSHGFDENSFSFHITQAGFNYIAAVSSMGLEAADKLDQSQLAGAVINKVILEKQFNARVTS